MKKKLEKRIKHWWVVFWNENKQFLRRVLWISVVGFTYWFVYVFDLNNFVNPDEAEKSIQEVLQVESARLAFFIMIMNYFNSLLR